MIEISGKRATGKTTRLMYMAAISKLPIITVDNHHAEIIKDLAKKFYNLDVEAYGYKDYLKLKESDKTLAKKEVLVDETLYILSELLDAKISAFTFTMDD